MKKVIPLVLICLGFVGCTTIKPQVKETFDQEPMLVGESMAKRISVATNDINNQLDLLNKINSGKYVGSFSMVTHNNEMDARKGASTTIPQAYAHVETKKPDSLKSVASPVQPAKDKIKKIDWKNGSLNDLVKSFGVATGYQVILVNDKKDKNVNFYVENEDVFSALNRLKTQVSPFSLLTIVEKNKMIYLNYN